jgi:peroxisomal 2,4-dienoyl-CoA reductase
MSEEVSEPGLEKRSVFYDDILEDRVALVTGGATGLGLEIARALGEHGARLCIASRKPDNLEAACRELEEEGLDCMWVVCDIREPDQVEHVVSEIMERHGRLDIVINNAAGNFPAPISGLSYNGFKAIVDIDLRGTYNVTKAAFEGSLKKNGGHIINISAPFQNQGVSLQAHVAAAKAGVDSLTRTCAVEFGPYGIRVNAIAPGGMADTEGLARFADAQKEIQGGGSNPLGYIGSKRDVANAVLFLLSDAGSYITGQVFAVDGGAGIDMLKMNLPREE